MLVHLLAIDLEALAELDVGLADDFFKLHLALEQRLLTKIIAVDVKQIEGDQHDLLGAALQLVLQHREVRGAIGGWSDYFAVDDRRTRLDVPGVRRDLPKAVGPVVAAPGKDFHRGFSQMDLNPVAIELDFVDPALAAWHPPSGARLNPESRHAPRARPNLSPVFRLRAIREGLRH
jgi:hypothetical protein